MRRLVVVSNRVAGADGASGGLAVALTAALQGQNALWFGWSGRRAERTGGEIKSHRLGDIERVTIDLEDADVAAYYDGCANAGLWPLFHSRLDLVAYDRSWSEGYLRVNRRFAFSLAQLLRPDDRVWVHDYHLIPLGRELRRLGFTGSIGFFLHTPWPDPQLLATLPDHKALVAAMFDYDLVGMQTDECVAAFQACVLREPNTWREESLLSAFGRRVRVEAFPIGLDTPDFLRLAASPEAARCGERLAAYRGMRTLIIG
ncbi:MAG TPA: trehalose-6-phosphate synthase, partial [Caulobacteraceae bacterium]|nr:trehalose-6-phosphate synthase [Caulobacteraceae bacterium]